MIYIFSYDYNDNLGSISPLSCSISIKRNEYQEATIEISLDDYKRNKTNLVLLNILQLDLKYDLEPFRIMSIDVNQKKATIVAKHYLVSAKKGYCTKWNWESFCSNVTPTLVNIIDNLQLAFSGDDTTYFEFENMVVGKGMTSSQDKMGILAWSEDGTFTSSKWTTQYTELSFFGSTVEEIVNELKDISDINVFCYSNMFICTFDSPSSYLKAIYSNITYNANYNTGQNADSFEYKLNADNFYAAARGYYEVFYNYRFSTNKYTELSNWKYNQWYRDQGASTNKCKRFPVISKYSSEVDWDRTMQFKANLYYVGYNSSYPAQIYWTKEFDNGDYALSSSDPIEITLKNIVGETIQDLTISEVTSGNVNIYDAESATTIIGHYSCTRSSTTEYKYNVTVSIVGNKYGAFKSGHEVASTVTTELTEPVNEQKLCDVFGGDIGYVDWASWTESDSGTKVWPIKHKEDGKMSKPGHLWITASELWSSYHTRIQTDINNQVKSYIDTFNQGFLENVSANPYIFDENSVITPGDNIKVWCAELEIGVDLAVEGIEWDPINRKYTNLSTGFYKKNLKQLNTSINNLQKTVKNLSK